MNPGDHTEVKLLREYGEYFLPARTFAPAELESFLNEQTALERIYLDESPESDIVCESHGFKKKLVRTIRYMDLTKELEVLWTELDGKRRNAIRSAIKNGVVVEKATSEDLNEFNEVWINGYCKKHGVSPAQNIGNIPLWIREGMLFIAREPTARKIIAGIKMRPTKEPASPRILIYSANTSLEEHLHLRPNDLLIWRIVEWAKQEGYENLNLNGDTIFKRKFSPTCLFVAEWIKKT